MYNNRAGVLATMLMMLLYSFGILAQTPKIKGKILDESDNSPIIGATIKVVNSTSGTISNANGEFSIAINLPAKITVSYIGYKTTTVDITDKEDMVVWLSAEKKIRNVKKVVDKLPESQPKAEVEQIVPQVSEVNIDVNKILEERAQTNDNGNRELPEKKYNNTFNFDDLKEQFRKKHANIASYHTMSFLNENYATAAEQGSISCKGGVELGARLYTNSPLFFDFTGFFDSFKSTSIKDISHLGIKAACSIIPFPSPKWCQPYLGIGCQASMLAADKVQAQTNTLYWKTGLQFVFSGSFVINFEYSQSELNKARGSNQISVGLGLIVNN